MADVTLIYAYWPNQPFGITWCDLPWAIRDAGLPKALSEAGHEVVESMLIASDEPPDDLLVGFKLASEVADEVRKARAAGELPVVLCGSCAVAAAGVIGGLGGAGTGIAWFDAHADLNTPETSTSGLFEGMALSVATGGAWQALAHAHLSLEPASLEAVALFGAREFDPPEQQLVAAHNMLVTTDEDRAARHLAGCDRVYAHVDMDVHSISEVRANAYADDQGPSVAEVRAALAQIDRIAALSITGLDPAVDASGGALRSAIGHVTAVAAGWTKADA
ncbi:MAG: arginase family protein [Pseudomonadota bacterium]